MVLEIKGEIMKEYNNDQIKEYAQQLFDVSESVFMAISKCEDLLADKMTDAIKDDIDLVKKIATEYSKISDENETIFQKLKTEILPMDDSFFVKVISEIQSDRTDKEMVIEILETCFRDKEKTISTFVEKWGDADYYENASDLYKLLKDNMQSNFLKSINKKFVKSDYQRKEPDPKRENIIMTSKVIPLSEVKISRKLKESLPSGYKIGKTFDYYKKNNSFHNDIILDQNGYLVYGYSKYLICKMLEISDVLCYNMHTDDNSK